MKLMNVQQNTPEWNQFRLNHFGASEAAAMLGVCPYKTREQLLKEKKTGVIPPVDTYTQKRFDHGHRCEALARPLAEKLIHNEELYPCVGVLENSRISASFDGITFDNWLVFEHKILNHTLRTIFKENAELPLHYRLQLEQQLLVSGAEKALFMASNWHENGELIEVYHREYLPDLALRQRIILGWKQFEKDLADYIVTEKTEKPSIQTLPELPLLQLQSRGNLSIKTNLDDLTQHAYSVLKSINTDLVAESDFGDAENAIKWCKTSEDQLTAALTQLIEESPDLNPIFSTIKSLQSHMRGIRLDLDKQVKTEKIRVKYNLIQTALNQIKAHYQAAHIDYLDENGLIHRLESAIKGLKNLDNMQNAIDRVVIAEKTALTQQLESGSLTRLINLEDINQAISPLSMSDAGLKQCGFNLGHQPIRAVDFPKLIQRLISILSAAQLPQSMPQVA